MAVSMPYTETVGCICFDVTPVWFGNHTLIAVKVTQILVFHAFRSDLIERSPRRRRIGSRHLAYSDISNQLYFVACSGIRLSVFLSAFACFHPS